MRGEQLEKMIDVVAPALIVEPERLALDERLQIGREISRLRHRRAMHQHRDDEHVAGKPGGDLGADEILGFVDPPQARRRARAEPLRSNDHQQHTARSDRSMQDVDKVLAGFDVVDVHEDRALAESCGQRVIEAANVTRAVVAAVADENAWNLRHVSHPPSLLLQAVNVLFCKEESLAEGGVCSRIATFSG